MFSIRHVVAGKCSLLLYDIYEEARFAFYLLKSRGGSLILTETATGEIWAAI